ncbi:MAG: hypothetical protein ACK6A4_13825, partial [Alphaproteobacteria bacterium]
MTVMAGLDPANQYKSQRNANPQRLATNENIAAPYPPGCPMPIGDHGGAAMREYGGFTYMLASQRNGTLYTGVTNNLIGCV